MYDNWVGMIIGMQSRIDFSYHGAEVINTNDLLECYITMVEQTMIDVSKSK